MRLVVTADTTRADIELAIAHVRAKQLACQVASMREELGEEVDRLLLAWLTAPETVMDRAGMDRR